LIDGLDAAGAEGGVIVVGADAWLPAPAAFAFFAVGVVYGDLQFVTFAVGQRQLRDVD